MLKKLTALAALAAAWASLGAMQAPQASGAVSLWRLDCGNATIKDYNAFFSDTSAYKPGPKEIADSCYLIRHGDTYMLLDAGLSDALIGKPNDNPVMILRVERSLADQLARLGVKPDQVSLLGISHYHGDHIGQADTFAKAKLLIGKGDLDALKAPGGPDAAPLAPWLTGKAPVDPVIGDRDIFGDGKVVMLSTPGHTPGHHSLLVRLPSGPVILSGDLWHFTEQVANDGVPPFNTDRAQSLASMDRIRKLARNIGATVVIQHERDDIGKLPTFPEPAK